jgi:hypothetical protein
MSICYTKLDEGSSFFLIKVKELKKAIYSCFKMIKEYIFVAS